MPWKNRVTPLEQRFWAKVDKRGPDECWLWTGWKNNKGYGAIGRGGRLERDVLVHRLAYEIAHGPIPAGETLMSNVVMHTCDVRSCCNPAHLRLGAPRDNTQDMIAKGRQRSRPHPGEANGSAKLTADDVRRIRAAYAAGSSIYALAPRFGVSETSVKRVITRLNWSHVL